MAEVGQRILLERIVGVMRFMEPKELRGPRGCKSGRTPAGYSFKTPSVTLVSRSGGHETQRSGVGVLTWILHSNLQRTGGHFARSGAPQPDPGRRFDAARRHG